MQETLDVIDRAAKASDRWLFIALLVIGMFTVGSIVRWFMAQLDKRDLKIEALTKEIGQVRGEFTAHLLASVKELQALLARNTEVIEANTEMSGRKMAILDRIEHRLSHP